MTNLFTGFKTFEIINIKNSSIPTKTTPDYPDYIDGAAEIVYDPVAGVIRACGGEEYNDDVDSCFIYDGLEWSEMAPTCEPWEGSFSFSDSYQRFSFFIPNIGWWMLKDGNCDNCNIISSCLYDTNTNTWREGPSLPTPEQFGYKLSPFEFCGALVNETHVMVSGGVIANRGPPISDVWMYNFLSNEWTPGPNMTKPRKAHSCAGISGGRVIVAGGDGLGGDLMDMEMFDPAADNGNGGWYGIGDLPEDDSDNHMLLQNGNDILWINYQKIWLYDLAENSWQLFEKQLTNRLSGGRAILIPDNFSL